MRLLPAIALSVLGLGGLPLAGWAQEERKQPLQGVFQTKLAAKSTQDKNLEKKPRLTFHGELANYVIRESHAFFGERRKTWMETSLRLGARFRQRRLGVEVSGLAIKTTGEDPFGTGSLPTGAPPGTRSPGGFPAFYLDTLFLQLENVAGSSLKLTVGRQPLVLGSQFLIGDGAYDGFSRNTQQGVYHNPRKGFDAVRAEWEVRATHFDAFLYRVHPTWDGGGGRDGLFGGLQISRSFREGRETLNTGISYRSSTSGLDNDMAVLNVAGEKFWRSAKGLKASGELVWEFAGRCRNAYYCTLLGRPMNE